MPATPMAPKTKMMATKMSRTLTNVLLPDFAVAEAEA
jgi:hypothetical protein